LCLQLCQQLVQLLLHLRLLLLLLLFLLLLLLLLLLPLLRHKHVSSAPRQLPTQLPLLLLLLLLLEVKNCPRCWYELRLLLQRGPLLQQLRQGAQLCDGCLEDLPGCCCTTQHPAGFAQGLQGVTKQRGENIWMTRQYVRSC
jgi:hypothetical protein